jgi:hypothetical protein
VRNVCLACRGKVVKGIETVMRSRYEEDVHPQNHTSVWGSYWSAGSWGYACCKSCIKNSMCLGDKAQQVEQQNMAMMHANAARLAMERAAAHASAEPSGTPFPATHVALCRGPACLGELSSFENVIKLRDRVLLHAQAKRSDTHNRATLQQSGAWRAMLTSPWTKTRFRSLSSSCIRLAALHQKARRCLGPPGRSTMA